MFCLSIREKDARAALKWRQINLRSWHDASYNTEMIIVTNYRKLLFIFTYCLVHIREHGKTIVSSRGAYRYTRID